MTLIDRGRLPAASAIHWPQRHPVAPPHIRLPDPLDPDEIDDQLEVVSRRALLRLALAASETGARFQRDGLTDDPLTWLTTPNELFGGASGINACLERRSCLRAVVLHGLGLALDTDLRQLDDLIGDDEGDFDLRGGPSTFGRVDEMSPVRSAAPRLFTATLVYDDDSGVVQAFDAAVLGSFEEMRQRISRRLGADLAEAADIVEGFSSNCPLVDAFVTEAMADMLRQIAAAPSSPLASGLEIVVQQRFAH